MADAINRWIDAEKFNTSREAFLSEYFHKNKERAKLILETHNSFSEYLFDLGKKAGYYEGSFDLKSFPKRPGSNNKLVDALGVSDSHLGYIGFNYGFQFKGPFVYEKNYFNMPWLIRSWDVKIELENGQFLSFNPVRTMKALLWNYREMISDILDLSLQEMQFIYKGMSKKPDKYSDHFGFMFKDAGFTGETLTAKVESASNYTTNEYNATYQNPALENNFGLLFRDLLHMSCGCGDKTFGSDTKMEYVSHEDPCKHILALMQRAKYFPEKIRIEKPKGKLGNLNNLFTCFDLQEKFTCPNGADNDIAIGVNSYLAWKIYKEKKPMYSAEYELLQNMGIEYLLSPFLLDNCFNNMGKDLKERTAILSGNVDNIDAFLAKSGSSRLELNPVYIFKPRILIKNVKAPLFCANIPSYDNDGKVNSLRTATVSVKPSRQKYTIKLYENEEDDPAFDPRSSHFYLNKPKQGISPDWNAFTDKGTFSFSAEKAAFLKAKNKSK